MSEKEIIVVEGNNVLSGEVRVSGAKNARRGERPCAGEHRTPPPEGQARLR